MNPKLAITLIAFALPLAGCGNKGPLVLAQPPEPAQVRETAPGQVPVEIVPDPDLTAEGTIPYPDAPEPAVDEPADEPVDEPAADDEGSPDDDAGG